jgi:hypothetical protein
MSDRLFLTPGSHGEVADLTGAHTRKGQLRVLQQNGTRHTINAAGWPVVPLSAIDGSTANAAAATPWRSNKKAA